MWVSFDEREGALIICGQERFFLTGGPDGTRIITSTRCRHRGGPLHMGRRDRGGTCIRCPWHNIATSIRSLARHSLTAARVGSRWTVRLPVATEAAPTVVVMPVPNAVAGAVQEVPTGQ